MTLKYILSTGLLAALLAVSLGTQAAADTDKATTAPAAVATSPADKTAKPASKAEDQAGAPQKAAQTKPDKSNPSKDKKRHLHPRDGK